MGKTLSLEEIKKRFNSLDTARKNWESHWQECADFHLPRKNTVIQTVTPGKKRNQLLFDNTGIHSLELLSGALHSMLTNPHSQFFELSTGKRDLDENKSVRDWMQGATVAMHNILNNTNFQTEVHEYYMDLICFGTGTLSMEEDPDDVIRFKGHFIKEIRIAENHRGLIDEVHRLFEWDATQIIKNFGDKNMHRDVLNALKTGDNRKFKILHSVMPKEIKKESRGPLKFRSVMMLFEFAHRLKEGGFKENPFIVGRWTKGTGEIYGRGPAMVSLPEMKTLNKMVEVTIKGAQKTIDPPLSAPDDGFTWPIRTKPGSVNIRRAGSNERIEPIFNDARIDFGFQVLEESRLRVRSAFFVDQLNLKDGPQMTATEVIQRTEESMRLLGPMLGRQEVEFLSPMVDRLLRIGLRKELIEEPPEVLQEKPFLVRFTSLVARTQRATEAANINRGLDSMGGFLEVDPTGVDNINVDEAIKINAKLFGWPSSMINAKDEVEKIRESRAQAQQEQQAKDDESRQADVDSKRGSAVAQLQASQG